MFKPIPHIENLAECTVKLTAVIEDDVWIGTGCFIGHNVVVRRGSVIGDNVLIGHNTVIEEEVVIGNGTRVQACCYLTKRTVIANDVFIGPCVSTFNDHKIAFGKDRGEFECTAPHVYPFVRIGGAVQLMPGIKVRENALIGTGSLVTKNVPANEIWYGHPATKQGVVPESERMI